MYLYGDGFATMLICRQMLCLCNLSSLKFLPTKGSQKKGGSLLEILYRKHACFNVFHAWSMHGSPFYACYMHEPSPSMHGSPSMHNTCTEGTCDTVNVPISHMFHAWNIKHALTLYVGHAWNMHGEARMKFAETYMKHACFLCSFSSRAHIVF